MPLDVYTVDAFTPTVFGGNPAAVVPLQEWLSDELMQNIGAEHNLSETAFFVAKGDAFHIRWFTPTHEVDLCGHATLATAHVLFTELGYAKNTIEFDCLKGRLQVHKSGDAYTMDFPADTMKSMPDRVKTSLEAAVGVNAIRGMVGSFDALLEIESEEMLRQVAPDMYALAALEFRGVLVTAPSERYDFVSRGFFPRYGIPEDPVTGSAHTLLTPYWNEQTGKTTFSAKQISQRGGEVQCELKGDRVILGGEAITFAKGQIFL